MTEGQKTALRAAYARHGRKTKDVIYAAWMSGNYRNGRLQEFSADLQQLRNTKGPSYLNNLNLSAI
tara:strand:+ start:2192 stop:2389 length:198 start_codon:yes stop_codon:yes gene_type:complete